MEGILKSQMSTVRHLQLPMAVAEAKLMLRPGNHVACLLLGLLAGQPTQTL